MSKVAAIRMTHNGNRIMQQYLAMVDLNKIVFMEESTMELKITPDSKTYSQVKCTTIYFDKHIQSFVEPMEYFLSQEEIDTLNAYKTLKKLTEDLK